MVNYLHMRYVVVLEYSQYVTVKTLHEFVRLKQRHVSTYI